MLISVRRRVLPQSDLEKIRQYVARGKPVIGIRTASHAFSIKNKSLPEGFSDWPEFDAEVFGGNYHGHLGNQLKSTIKLVEKGSRHPIITGLTSTPFEQGWSLYQTSPFAPGTNVLLTGQAEGHPPEPVAWTYTRADSGRSFYTSLGHIDDFKSPGFVRLLQNALRWSADLNINDHD